jgi:hypothetical protein
MLITVVCHRPGLIRAGKRHPKVESYLVTQFTADQLREMLAEPELTIVVGHPLTTADIGAIEQGTQAAREPAEAGTAAAGSVTSTPAAKRAGKGS